MQNKTPHSRLLLAALSLSAIVFSGCQSYESVSAGRDSSVRSGDFAAAVATANRDAEKNKDNKDTILYRLEQGSILRAAAGSSAAIAPVVAPETAPSTGVTTQQTETNVDQQANALNPSEEFIVQSIEAFDAAEERVNSYEEAAKVKVGSEAGALLTNQANMPYRGRAYDKVMMNTYKALNYMQLGDFDAARVELNRALQRQRDAVDANAKRIEEAQELAEKAKAGDVKDEEGRQGSSYDVDKAKSDPKTGAALTQIENELDSKIQAYGDYVNPFAVFLDGLYFLHHAADGSDLERARVSFQRVASMAPDNRHVAAELEAASNAQSPENVTYVIFETGSAPHREQIRIDIPIGLVTSQISYVGAAFPKLKFSDNYSSALYISDGLQNYQTSLLCSMDSVVAQDFKNEWPSILTRTLISTATKAIIDATIQNEAKRHGWQAQLLAKVATGIAQASVNIADTRSWRSLPKEFQYVRISNPESGLISISDGVQNQTVNVEPNTVNVVYVKSTSPNAPLLVTQFRLK